MPVVTVMGSLVASILTGAFVVENIFTIRKETNTAIMLIAHDFEVVANLADRVAVMYEGKVVEEGDVRDIFYKYAHPYTRVLLKSLPKVDTDKNELLETVGLNKEYANRFPHEFSGEPRQRIGIARALAVETEFIVCDEPISVLDVSIRCQVINLLKRLQEERKFTYMFIAHDLNLVKYISDRIAVMYFGNLVELADSEEIYKYTLHSYSQALLDDVPIPDPDREEKRKEIFYQERYQVQLIQNLAVLLQQDVQKQQNYVIRKCRN